MSSPASDQDSTLPNPPAAQSRRDRVRDQQETQWDSQWDSQGTQFQGIQFQWDPAQWWTRVRKPAEWLLYVAAIFVVLRNAVVLPLVEFGSDFVPIWDAVEAYTQGQPVYTADYSSTDPHYLYSPGATLLLSPIGWVFSDFEVARYVMMLLGAVSILAALAWALRLLLGELPTARELFQRPESQYFWPLYALTVFVTFLPEEPVQTTLVLTNINGFLLLVQVVFAWALLRVMQVAPRPRSWRPADLWQATKVLPQGRWLETIIVGIALATALTIKPQFVVLAGVTILTLQWIPLVIGAVIYLVWFGLGWITMAQPEDFFTRLLPYLSEPRPYANGSIPGLALEYGWPDPVTYVASAVMLIVAGLAVWFLLRFKHVDPVMWLFATIGVAFIGVLMVSGLVQAYYVIWLIPLAMTILRTYSPMYAVVPWLCFMLLFGDWGALGQWRPLAWAILAVWIAIWAMRTIPNSTIPKKAVPA